MTMTTTKKFPLQDVEEHLLDEVELKRAGEPGMAEPIPDEIYPTLDTGVAGGSE